MLYVSASVVLISCLITNLRLHQRQATVAASDWSGRAAAGVDGGDDDDDVGEDEEAAPAPPFDLDAHLAAMRGAPRRRGEGAAEQAPAPPRVLVYNRVPKTGSTSLTQSLIWLATARGGAPRDETAPFDVEV